MKRCTAPLITREMQIKTTMRYHHITVRRSIIKKGTNINSGGGVQEREPSNTIGGAVNSVQSLSLVRLFVTPWTTAHQASLSITNSWSLLKFTSIKSVMPSNHLILCIPLLLLPSILPSIRVFSNESVCIRWPKYCSFSFSISPSSEY